MAQALEVLGFIFPSAFPGSNARQFFLADQGAAGTETDTGFANFRFIRGCINIKSGMTNSNTFTIQVLVDDGAGMSTPDRVYRSPAMVFNTNDVGISQCFFGICQQQAGGFRYFKIVGTDSGGTAVYDALVECY